MYIIQKLLWVHLYSVLFLRQEAVFGIPVMKSGSNITNNYRGGHLITELWGSSDQLSLPCTRPVFCITSF